MREGFLHDALDIKMLILYIAAQLVEPVGVEVLTDLALCDGGVDYFSFSQCLNELVQSGHLTRTARGLYSITDKGRSNGEICQSSLPYSVRKKVDSAAAACNARLKRERMVTAKAEPRGDGSFSVTLSLNDDMDSLMSLRLFAAQKEIAVQITEHFESDAEAIYHRIMQMLLCGENE